MTDHAATATPSITHNTAIEAFIARWQKALEELGMVANDGGNYRLQA